MNDKLDAEASAGRVLELTLAEVRPMLDNVRSDLGDVTELADSIREVGVLQPIGVYASKDGYELAWGARRLAAAELAGRFTIPAIVSLRPDEATRVVAMLVENVQRRNLSPFDEAAALSRLEQEFELSQRDIARRVGWSQKTVSRRLALLSLPTPARELVEKGDLSLELGVELSKLADAPEELADLVTELDRLEGEDRVWAVEEAVERREAERSYAVELARLEAAGATVLTADQMNRHAPVVPPAESWRTRRALILKPKDIAKHAGEPCHAVALSNTVDDRTAWRELPYCVNPERHDPDGPSKLKRVTVEDPADAAHRERKDRERAAQQAAKDRAGFVRDLLRNRSLDRALVTALALRHVALDGYSSKLKKRAELLGLDLEGRDPAVALGDWIVGDTDRTLRAVLAAMLETAVTQYADDRAKHLLGELGYEPSADELRLNEQRAEDTARRAVDDAAYAVERRAQELGEAETAARVAELALELEEATGARINEIRLELDGLFAQLNNLEPGDVVDPAGDGGHVVTRESESDFRIADAPDGDVVTNTPDLDAFGSDSGPSNEEAKAIPLDAGEWIDELPEAHSKGDARPPAEQSDAEAWACQAVEGALELWPDNATLQRLQRALWARPTEQQAKQITEYVRELFDSVTDYVREPCGAIEATCRTLILELPDGPDRQRLQRDLWVGLGNTGRSSAVRRELKELIAKAAQ